MEPGESGVSPSCPQVCSSAYVDSSRGVLKTDWQIMPGILGQHFRYKG